MSGRARVIEAKVVKGDFSIRAASSALKAVVRRPSGNSLRCTEPGDHLYIRNPTGRGKLVNMPIDVLKDVEQLAEGKPAK
jgi:hypothetical protein